MAPPSSLQTSPSLLRRLAADPADQSAWFTFNARYRPFMEAWCRARGLQTADGEEVTQNVLMGLTTRLRAFDYDPARGRFRGWLKTVVKNALQDLMKARQRRVLGSGDSKVLAVLESVEDREDLQAHLTEALCDREAAELAMERARRKVGPREWEAFRLKDLEGTPLADIVGQLGVSLSIVYRASDKVRRLVREELAVLQAGDE